MVMRHVGPQRSQTSQNARAALAAYTTEHLFLYGLCPMPITENARHGICKSEMKLSSPAPMRLKRLLQRAVNSSERVLPRRISGGRFELGGQVFGHPVEESGRQFFGLGLLIFERSRLTALDDHGLPTALSRFDHGCADLIPPPKRGGKKNPFLPLRISGPRGSYVRDMAITNVAVLGAPGASGRVSSGGGIVNLSRTEGSVRSVETSASGICQVVQLAISGYFKHHENPNQCAAAEGLPVPRIIAYRMLAYHRFAMRHCDVEGLRADRGVIVRPEAIRVGVTRFGSTFANWSGAIVLAPMTNASR